MEILVLVRQFSILVNEGRRIWCLLDPVEAEKWSRKKHLGLILFCPLGSFTPFCFALQPGAEVGTCVLKSKVQFSKRTLIYKLFPFFCVWDCRLCIKWHSTEKDGSIPVTSMPTNRKEWAYIGSQGEGKRCLLLFRKTTQRYSTVDALLPGLGSRIQPPRKRQRDGKHVRIFPACLIHSRLTEEDLTELWGKAEFSARSHFPGTSLQTVLWYRRDGALSPLPPAPGASLEAQ